MEYELFERQLDSTKVFEGRLLHVYKDNISLPDDSTSTREYIVHNGACCIIPVTYDKKVVMVKQYRYPIGKVLLEIPAGKLDSVDEDPLECAKRELREEAGATADKIISLGDFYPTPAYSSEVIHMYMAYGINFVGEKELDDDEFLNNEIYDLDELVKMALNNEILDGKTQAAILRADWIIKNELD